MKRLIAVSLIALLSACDDDHPTYSTQKPVCAAAVHMSKVAGEKTNFPSFWPIAPEDASPPPTPGKAYIGCTRTA